MKKHLSLAIFVMAVATIVSVAVVSCKKDNENALLGNNNETSKSFDMRQIDDMNAYLKGFKQKMMESKDSEVLNLKDAAWHLSNVANYDFANVNVEFTDLLFDTIYSHINVNNGMVKLSDLGYTYAELSTEIETRIDKLSLCNKQIRLIEANISNDGTVTVGVIVTYEDNSKYHDWWPSDSVYCNLYFDEYTPYYQFENGMQLLKEVLNIIVSHNTVPGIGRVYYVTTRTEHPSYEDYIDPYGAPNFKNSRIHCTDGYFHARLSCEQMHYYLPSYHQIGLSFLDPLSMTNEDIVGWDVGYAFKLSEDPELPNLYHHNLSITYGYPVEYNGGNSD